MDVIEVKNLYFSYDTASILENVSFKIPEGSFIGVIGPNGGGKTTLLKLLLGFLPKEKGFIHVLKRNPTKGNPKVGYVPQFFPKDKDFPISVLEVILLGALEQASWRGFPPYLHTKALDLLEKLQLGNFSKRPFGSLSGGQAQRVLFARALINDPDLLILDEPTAHIDNEAEKIILQLLLEIKRKKTILMVTHHLSTIVQEVDAVLSVQKKVLFLEPKEICEHFALGLFHEPLIDQKPHHLHEE
ncbi:MAG: ATP-binding cassette domain-containing protein [Chlamydiota bacterium]